MFGWMRDDGADFVGSYPTQSSTLTSQLLGAGYVHENKTSPLPLLLLEAHDVLC